jgi:hypothetical protein
MKNSFIINYNLNTITLKFNGQFFTFDLNDGDVGDYWNSFEINENMMDVNFYQETKNETPSLTVYPLIKKTIDTKNGISIPLDKKVGNPDKYFN